MGVNRELGRYDASISSGLQGIQITSLIPPDPRQFWGFYSSSSLSLLRLGCLFASLDIQLEAHQIALNAAWPLNKSLSYMRLGLIYAELGKGDEALQCTRRSLDEAGKISDEAVRKNTMADALFYQGQLLRKSGDSQAALSSYEYAISLYDTASFQLYSYKAQEGRFLSRLALHDDSGARESLGEVVRLLDSFRGQIIEESARNAFVDEGVEFFDAAIQYLAQNQEGTTAAFELSENSRARSLLDLRLSNVKVIKDGYGKELQSRTVSESLNLNEIQRRLPKKTQIVHYALLPNKIIAWVIHKNDYIAVQQKLSAQALAEKIARFTEGISRPGAGSHDNVVLLGQELYDILIEPLIAHLNGDELLCIIPDKDLNFLPFSALVSKYSDRYLIEDFTLLTAPSSTAFIACAEAAIKINGKQESALFIGNPEIADSENGLLPELQAATSEVEEIAQLHPSRQLITKTRAKESLFMKLAPLAQVIHIASHAITDQRSPLLSKLLLAPDFAGAANEEGADGSLHAYELYRLKLPLTRLVILSACKTGVGRASQSEGVMSLARPFLATGVSTVVASLWAVDSEQAKNLMTNFYRHYLSGKLPVAQALKTAQIEMLQHERKNLRQTHAWASFVVIGSSISS